ncbi:uncharacterized protein LOC124288485 [Haliotis rubra]|uniref:uncharacterized protein LOC124288485 n=1 Tax=Haliotis rubra TaxID=36100 RepID=UPI001EE549F1|nr:uncharacterized protein LOC124288485 [Haliotis rubra]
MYKRSFVDSTHASSASGFRYYGASCTMYKSSNQCQAGFSLYPGTGPADAHCYSAAGLWVLTGSSSNVCKQDEWINTTEVSIPLPAPIVPGVTIDIRGSRKNNSELFSALRQSGSTMETTLLRVMPDDDTIFGVYTSITWVGSYTIPNFPIAPEVVFDLNVVVTELQFKVKLNGNILTSFDIGNPLNVSTLIQMYYWRSVERVKLTYP